MKKLINSLYFVILIFIACDHTVVRHYSSFPNEISLTSDSVSTQSMYDFIYLTTYDSFFLVSSYQTDTMLHVYSTPDLQLLFGNAIKGHSAKEFSSFPSFCESNGRYLYIRGHTPNIIRRYIINNEDLSYDDEYKLFLDCTPNDIHLLEDSLLYFADFESHTLRKYNIKRRKEIVSSPVRIGIENKATDIDEYLGSFAANQNTAIYAYQYKKEIEVYNTEDLSPKFCIKWDYENQLHSIHSKDVKDITLHYTGAVATKNFFYALHRGYTPNDQSGTSSIEVYSCMGEPLLRYKLDKKIFSFAVDERNGYFYGFGPNDDYIYRFCFIRP